VDEETGALDLTVGVEGDETDVCVREGLGAELDLLHDLGTISASEHGELPHGPVTVVLVGGGSSGETDSGGVVDVSVVGISELQAGGESVVDDVVNLLGDLLVGEGGEVGESLEELVVSGVPDLESGGLGNGAVADRHRLEGLAGRLEGNLARGHRGGDNGGRDGGSHCEVCGY